MVEIQYTKINFRITLKVRWKEKEKKEGRNKGKEKKLFKCFPYIRIKLSRDEKLS